VAGYPVHPSSCLAKRVEVDCAICVFAYSSLVSAKIVGVKYLSVFWTFREIFIIWMLEINAIKGYKTMIIK
jgi:hypothetical protein